MNHTALSEAGAILAGVIGQHYTGDPDVTAAMIGGSVARGCADEFSDVEIGVFWRRPPSEAERREAVATIGGRIEVFDRTPGHEFFALNHIAIGSVRYTGSALISIHHLTVEETEAVIEDVLGRLDTDLGKQALMAALETGIPLAGSEILERWQTGIKNFPLGLSVKIVQENLWFGPWFNFEAYAKRDDELVLRQHFLWVAQGILRVLAGLNRFYYPSPEHKWMDWLTGRMALAPVELSYRLKRAVAVPSLNAWSELRGVMDETITLVETHLPEVNTMSLFPTHPEVNTAWARRRWLRSQPYSLLREIASGTA